MPRTPEDETRLAQLLDACGAESSYIGSVVTRAGDAEHLFEVSGLFLFVTEAVTVSLDGSDSWCPDQLLEGFGMNMEEFRKRFPKATFTRHLHLEYNDDEEAALWCQEHDLAGTLPEPLRSRIYGNAEEVAKSLATWSDANGSHRLLNWRGQFLLRTEGRGDRPLACAEALQLLARHALEPAIDRLLPESMSHLFRLGTRHRCYAESSENTLRGTVPTILLKPGASKGSDVAASAVEVAR